jgi:acylphosphatase
MVHFDISITGKVQGVFFRKYTKEAADRLGVKGIVRNEEDGSVYAEAEGEAAAVAKFIEWCHRGSPSSRVENVQATEGKMKGYTSFVISR